MSMSYDLRISASAPSSARPDHVCGSQYLSSLNPGATRNTPCRSAHRAQPITLDTSLLPAQFRPPKMTSIRHVRPLVALYPSGTRYHTFGVGLFTARVRTVTLDTMAGEAWSVTARHTNPIVNRGRIMSQIFLITICFVGLQTLYTIF